MHGGSDSLRAREGRVGAEEDNKEEEDDYNPGIKAGRGASESIFFNSSTPCKKRKLFDLFFLFGPEATLKYWTHWFTHVEVITIPKSKLLF